MALPVFLSVFFLLLFLVKFTCTGMLLDYAVNETAKEIAATAYPISFINELEDEKLAEYGESLPKPGQHSADSACGGILDNLLSGDFKGIAAADSLTALIQDYIKGAAAGVIEGITPSYWDMKSEGKEMIAGALLEEHLDSPLIKRENVSLSLVEFPQSKSEYEGNFKSGKYESSGLIPGSDFTGDDVVVQLEYDYSLKLPFLEALHVKMVHTSVERAWINGGFGILTSEEEGLDLEPEGSMVFITRTGIRYHKGSCWHLRRSRLPIELGEAKGRGYTPCKVCKPPN